LYDLSLGLLAAYGFNFLVVVLPAQRKQKSRFVTLRTQLSTIANNGMDIIRDLEKIAECPPRRITEEHLIKVLMATNDNPAVKAHIAERLSHAKSAYAEIVPYAADLPLDLQEGLQHESQEFLHKQFPGEPMGARPARSPISELRQISKGPVYSVQSDGSYVLKRQHLAGYASSFLSYYLATEDVRNLVEKYTFSTRRQRMSQIRPTASPLMYLFGIELNDPNFPYWEYPPAASNDDFPKNDS